MAKLYRRCAFLPMSILKGEKKLCREKERSLLHRIKYIFKSVSSISQPCLTLCDPLGYTNQASLTITNSQSLLKLTSIESVMPSNHLILSSPSPPTFNLSQHQGLF